MGLQPFFERAIAATLWTLGAGAVAVILGLVIGSYGSSTRAGGLALGFDCGQLLAACLCPVVLWWRVYRTMWLHEPRRQVLAREARIETSGSAPFKRGRPVKPCSKPQIKPEETIEGAEKPKPKREPRARRESAM